MRRQKMATKFLSLILVCATAFGMTGCANTKPTAEQLSTIAEAISTGDSKAFYTSMEQSDKFDHYFDAVNNKADSGLGKVYVKISEKAQEITLDMNEKGEELDFPVTVSYYDGYSAAVSKMFDAAVEGPEAFMDMPTWLCAALDEAELVSTDVVFDSRIDTNTLRYKFGPNGDFFRGVTCGMYDFFDATMTTCKGDDYVCCLVSKGDRILFSVDYYYTTVAETGLTEEELNQYIAETSAEYDACSGIAADFQYDGEVLTEVIFISYEAASNSDLAKIGLVTGSGDGYISLKKTISDYKQNGMTCETDTFGIINEDEEE